MTPSATGFRAPLSGRVRATSLLGSVVLVLETALMLGLSRFAPRPASTIFLSVGLALIALLILMWLLAIRGYRIEGGNLYVDRPLWSSSHSLEGLRSVARDDTALRFTWQGFGNNGFFALNGWRKIDPYGWCRVLATRTDAPIVLSTAAATYVVTPDRPDEFVQQALALARG
jgi:PH (Pleckstrin Homology) domain-containing protein